ncbi:hypothetical protein FKW77_001359 [Venturia effusa]|uniref:Uncharacterized protein n=1 Tax=Venturia effusa TaxID=50376 RepID=A0A517LNC5_9PEZI|nr:hypothetical protein FKW77_001359 [Venturia effusa]
MSPLRQERFLVHEDQIAHYTTTKDEILLPRPDGTKVRYIYCTDPNYGIELPGLRDSRLKVDIPPSAPISETSALSNAPDRFRNVLEKLENDAHQSLGGRYKATSENEEATIGSPAFNSETTNLDKANTPSDYDFRNIDKAMQLINDSVAAIEEVIAESKASSSEFQRRVQRRDSGVSTGPSNDFEPHLQAPIQEDQDSDTSGPQQ